MSTFQNGSCSHIDKNALSEQGLENFVGLHQAALYCALYWGTACFKEIIDLEIKKSLKKGASIELQIRKLEIYKSARLMLDLATSFLI